MSDSCAYRAGHIAIVGRPNVGKSSLLNALLGEKLSITAPKPQTTRHQIMGIHTTPSAQFVYVDTPGLHQRRGNALNRQLNRSAASIMGQVDVLVFVVQAMRWTGEDEAVLQRLSTLGEVPVLLVVNKVDLVKDKTELLPFLQKIAERHPFAAIVPVSARKGSGLEQLAAEVEARLPESEPLYPEDQISTQSERFFVAEMIREKAIRLVHDEIPYSITVEVESFREETVPPTRAGQAPLQRLRIDAVIWVEKEGHKAIVIGEGGQRLKEIGTQARQDIERFLDRRVHLGLWVKVKAGWADDERALNSLGYGDTL
ncbi:MAG: GTPase Era [Halothiobacillaceae bacterium]|nr:GTPase Era [Halothiobacillaceae bacterium]MDD3609934.1 GTPase Era [Halothiobacillaceae bacterium]